MKVSAYSRCKDDDDDDADDAEDELYARATVESNYVVDVQVMRLYTG